MNSRYVVSIIAVLTILSGTQTSLASEKRLQNLVKSWVSTCVSNLLPVLNLASGEVGSGQTAFLDHSVLNSQRQTVLDFFTSYGDVEEALTAAIRQSAFRQFGGQALKIINGGRALPLMRAGSVHPMIAAAFFQPFRPLAQGIRAYDHIDERKFLERIKKLSKSQQKFWAIKIPRNPDKVEWATALREDLESGGSRRFLLEWDEDSIMVIVPTFGLLQAYIDTLSLDGSFPLLPAFGITGVESVLRSIGEGGRILAMHLPGVMGLTHAHWTYYGEYLSTLHDVHHAYAAARYPVEYRRVLPLFLDVVRAKPWLLAVINPMEAFVRTIRRIDEHSLETVAAYEAAIEGMSLAQTAEPDFSGDRNEAIARDIERLFQRPALRKAIVQDLRNRSEVYSERGFNAYWFIQRLERGLQRNSYR